jgi:hypothetical protein
VCKFRPTLQATFETERKNCFSAVIFRAGSSCAPVGNKIYSQRREMKHNNILQINFFFGKAKLNKQHTSSKDLYVVY